MNIEVFNHIEPLINHTKLTILSHGYLKTDQSWNFERLYAPYNRLYFVLDGSGDIQSDKIHFSLQKGKIYLIPGPNLLNLKCDHYLEKFYIHFKIDILPGQDLFSETIEPYFELDFDTSTILNLIDHLRTNSLHQTLHLHSILIKCISSCIDENKLRKQLSISRDYEEILNYIRTHCYADLRVKDIAFHYNLSVNYLSQKFKQDTGINLKKYITHQILRKSEERLIFSDKSIKYISQEMKFTDEFHFSNFFKKHIGISPKEYRTQNNLYIKND